MGTVLIAGATGYLGGHAVREFGRRGHHVRALVRPGKSAPGADEVVEAEATAPGGLDGVCDGADIVFSALGTTRQRDAGWCREVDYGANLALLREAERSGVNRFGVISVVDPQRFRGNAMVDAKEEFVSELMRSCVEARVVRATGFFSDMAEFLAMARRRVVAVFGSGTARINPIHGTDVASACVDAIEDGQPELFVGGPEVLSFDEIAALALRACCKRGLTMHLPAAAVRGMLPIARAAAPKSAVTVDFLLRVMSADLVAEQRGEHRLADFFADVAAGAQPEAA
jgi:uncharacterized protein YbjT (DUF2867 family)